MAAENYQDIGLSLDKRLIRRPAATFFLRAAENDAAAGLKAGDLLVIDRAEPPSAGRLFDDAAARRQERLMGALDRVNALFGPGSLFSQPRLLPIPGPRAASSALPATPHAGRTCLPSKPGRSRSWELL